MKMDRVLHTHPYQQPEINIINFLKWKYTLSHSANVQ